MKGTEGLVKQHKNVDLKIPRKNLVLQDTNMEEWDHFTNNPCAPV